MCVGAAMMQKAVMDLSPEGGMAESSTKKKILRWDPKKRKFIKVSFFLVLLSFIHTYLFIYSFIHYFITLLFIAANSGGNDVDEALAIRGQCGCSEVHFVETSGAKPNIASSSSSSLHAFTS
jgi:hypothetical protein